MKNNNKPTKPPIQPEILYEETKPGEASQFPFIETVNGAAMPISLWIMEYVHTGEFEPGPRGEEVPIVEQHPHMYVDFNVLKEKLRPDLFDEVRVALGMLPLKEASRLGKEKLDKVLVNIDKMKQDLLSKKEEN